MLTYQTAEEKFRRAKDPEKGVGLGARGARLLRVGEQYAVRYHETNVVLIGSDDSYTLFTGGWHTVTTKARIREHSPALLYAENGVWFIGETPFFEGIRVDRKGAVLNPPAKDPKLLARKARLDKAVSTYIKGFEQHVLKKGLEDPGPGDCWYCSIFPRKTPDTDVDHLLSHLKEKYYVPSLLWNALVEACTPRHYSQKEEAKKAKERAAAQWHMTKRDLEQGHKPYFLRRALTRYFRERKPALLDSFT